MGPVIANEYFEWMCSIIFRKRYSDVPFFRKLLMQLHSTEFTYIMEMDENRATDGADLRYKFGLDEDVDPSEIQRYLDNRPCSVLEMMVALAVRCETDIMDDDDKGDRTSYWFWSMIESLGLGYQDYCIDGTFMYDKNYISDVIERFLKRAYKPDGKGGLFTVKGSKDMRDTEIWYQMMFWLRTQK